MNYLVCRKENKSKIDKDGIIVSDIKEALDKAKAYDIIYLYDDFYFGKYYIVTPNLTIIGIDKPVISYDARNGMVVRDCDGGDGIKTYGTTGSASVTVKPDAINLRIENVVIKNDYHRKKGDKGTQNVAFKTEATGGVYVNVDFISEQDTLYIDNDDNYFDSCYIEGDVDFIFGSGCALINNSVIKMIQVLDSNAYLCAPDTYVSRKFGFIFSNCDILSVGDNKKYLGRAWYPSGALEPVCPKALFYKCKFPSDLDPKIITMHEGDPTNFVYYIHDCIQNGSLIDNTNDDDLSDLVSLYLGQYNDYLIKRLADLLLDRALLLHQKALYVARINYALKDDILKFQELNYKLSYYKEKEKLIDKVSIQALDSLEDRIYEALKLERLKIEETKSIINMTIDYIENPTSCDENRLVLAFKRAIRFSYPAIIGSYDENKYNQYEEAFINEDIEMLESIEENFNTNTNIEKLEDEIKIVKQDILNIKNGFPFEYIIEGKINLDKLNKEYDNKISMIKDQLSKIELRLEEKAPISGLES